MRPQPRAPDSGHYEVASDGGGEHWAILASLIETCKLNGVDPQTYLADVFARLVAGHSINQLHQLLPWSWAAAHQTRRAA
jgi:transposase